MKTLILLLLLLTTHVVLKAQGTMRFDDLSGLEGWEMNPTMGHPKLSNNRHTSKFTAADSVFSKELFTLYPVNQIRNAKAEPLDGKGYFGIRYNSKSIGISEYYSEVGSFVYYKIKEGESIREALMYRVKILVLTDSGQIFYYDFNKQRRGWVVAHGKKYNRFRKQFKKE